jgi:hypothetical protein
LLKETFPHFFGEVGPAVANVTESDQVRGVVVFLHVVNVVNVKGAGFGLRLPA